MEGLRINKTADGKNSFPISKVFRRIKTNDFVQNLDFFP